jgi:hypothetical protein
MDIFGGTFLALNFIQYYTLQNSWIGECFKEKIQKVLWFKIPHRSIIVLGLQNFKMLWAGFHKRFCDHLTNQHNKRQLSFVQSGLNEADTNKASSILIY